MKTDVPPPSPAFRASPLRLLFLVVFIATLTVPLFNKMGPSLFGLPFFYWYQIACVPVSSVLIFIVFRAEDKGDRK